MGAKHRWYAFWVLLLLWIAWDRVVAQTQRGTITGRVTDSTGTVIVGAEIQAENPELGVSLEATSNEEGLYSVPYLNYGTYNLAVNATGFKPYNVTGVLVVAATTTTINVELNVAEVASEVNVEASPVILLEKGANGRGQFEDQRWAYPLDVGGIEARCGCNSALTQEKCRGQRYEFQRLRRIKRWPDGSDACRKNGLQYNR